MFENGFAACLRFWVCLIVLLVSFCSDRQRTNPLDPRNPNSGGRIRQVGLVSRDDEVTVYWEALALEGITGYNVYRRGEGESVYEMAAHIPHPGSEFVDSGRIYDQEISYRLSVQVDAYESPLSDSASITPGPYSWWVADYYGGVVAKLTYDGLHIIAEYLTGVLPVSVVVDSVSEEAWVIDLSGSLVKFSEQHEEGEWIVELETPEYIDINGPQDRIWVSDSSGTQLVWLDGTGRVIGRLKGYTEISGLSASGRNGGCWISDKGNGQLMLVSQEGVPVLCIENDLQTPGILSYDDGGEFVWVADGSTLCIVGLEGIIQEVIEFGHPIRHLSAVQGKEACWLIIDGEVASSREVLKVNREGEIRFRSNEYGYGLSLESNSYNGGCLIAETGVGSIAVLSGDGVFMGRLQVFAGPTDIALE